MIEFSPSTEVFPVTAARASSRRSLSAGWRALAGLFVAAFGVTVAVPAYAISPDSEASVYAVKRGAVQEFFVSYADGVETVDQAGSYSLDVVAAPAAPAQRPEVAAATAQGAANSATARSAAISVPAGPTGARLLAAARAQLGIRQDCTDMVQNALAALGYTTRRDEGGLDHGVPDFLRYGVVVPSSEAQPGDIMIEPGFHVAIYAGNNTAVHGGYSGGNTVENSWRDSNPNNYTYIVRVQ